MMETGFKTISYILAYLPNDKSNSDEIEKFIKAAYLYTSQQKVNNFYSIFNS